MRHMRASTSDGSLRGSSTSGVYAADEADPSVKYVDHGDHFHLYLQVENAAEVAKALERRGVRLAKPVTGDLIVV